MARGLEWKTSKERMIYIRSKPENKIHAGKETTRQNDAREHKEYQCNILDIYLARAVTLISSILLYGISSSLTVTTGLGSEALSA